MKLKIISYSAKKGGAAKAATNFLYLINENENYDAELISVTGTLTPKAFIKASVSSVAWHYFKMIISRFFTYFERSNNIVKYSLNIFTSKYVLKELRLKSNENELIHLNWINNDTLSLLCLKKLFKLKNKKILLTLHDEWFYCSTEHYADFKSSSFINGYKDDGYISRFVFNLKKKIDFNRVVISVPSQWLHDRAKQSYLLRNSEIHILPNAIDTDIFHDMKDIRLNRHALLEVDEDSFIIGFGAVSGSSNPLKGFDLLIGALQKLTDNEKTRIILLTFGAKDLDSRVKSLGCKIVNMGFIANAEAMASIYNNLDIMIVPSRAESFGQVAAESLACQTPVVAFNYSGIKDIVTHKRNGLLAEPFSIDSLTDNIRLMMTMSNEERIIYGENGRKDVIEKFGKEVVLDKYIKLLDYVKGATNEE